VFRDEMGYSPRGIAAEMGGTDRAVARRR
jgi:hypothetical protein